MSAATAVVLAGSRPGKDPFAESYGTDLKALIPVGGEPMVRRPVEALLQSEGITLVRVLAQQPERIREVLPEDARISVEASGDTIAATLEKMCVDPSVRWPILVTTADHALLTPAMIADFLGKAAEADVAIGLVSQAALLKRLPQTKRTWLKFRGGAYSGANLFLLGSPKIRSTLQLWGSNEQNRKKAIRMLLTLGVFGFLGALFRLRTLQQTLDGVGRKLGLHVQAVELSDPLAAVDVDKPADHELVTAILEGRA
ncbi:NTP transferase domain-containing protein [Sphingomonas daechungensis]|uniref:NTP transferase domain-containing protein n=1 Tax=Sphingomonas daechungensis TaxID=1176646 RepID=UPI0037836D42